MIPAEKLYMTGLLEMEASSPVACSGAADGFRGPIVVFCTVPKALSQEKNDEKNRKNGFS